MKLYRGLLGIILLLLLITGCSKNLPSKEIALDKKIIENGESINIYISANGDLLYCDGNLSEDSVSIGDVVSLGIRKDKNIISEIEEDNKGDIYCTISTSDGNKIGNKIYVINQDNIKDIIELEKNFGPNKIIHTGSELYVAGAIKPASYNENGIPYAVLDEENEEVTNEFYIKGILGASVIYNNYTYMVICEAEKIGYTGFDGSYMLRINNETKEIEIINDEIKADTPRDMAVDSNGNLYVIDTPMFTEEDTVSVMYKYDVEGNELSTYQLEDWADKIIIGEDGLAYITHRGESELYDDMGQKVTVFDTEKEETVEEIQVGKGPSDLYMYDKYLFVTNYTDSSVSVMNMDTNNKIGEITIDDRYKIDQIIVTDH